MKSRLAGLGLWALLLPLALVAFFVLPLVVLFATIPQVKNSLRGFDHMVSAVVVGGSPYMSLSAWCWLRQEHWWAKAVIWITNQIEPGHCSSAYLDEVPWIELLIKEGQI